MNKLAQKFTAKSLIAFAMPSMIVMVFMSMYTMADGVFVSNLIGSNALSAINLVYPISSVIIAIAVMLGTGGSAIIAKKLGENKAKDAREDFSLIVVVGAVVGIIITILSFVFSEQIIRLLGATDATYQYCKDYFMTLMFFAPFSVLQLLIGLFFVTAGKPNISLIATLIAGVTNIVLDYIFIAKLGLGITGAALATGIGYCIPAIVGVIYFYNNKKGTLYFVAPKWDKKVLLQTCYNGSSEMVSNIATAITTFMFNIIMLKLLGEDGVAAITVVLYAQFFLTALYLGFSIGVSPVFSYNYGEKNYKELKKVFKISRTFILISSAIIFIISLVFSESLVAVFAQPGTNVFNIANQGFMIFSISYLITGINIFASGLFTAFSDGKTSAIISFLRTFILLIIALIILPFFFGVSGVWFAVPVAEILTVIVSVYYIRTNKYNYL